MLMIKIEPQENGAHSYQTYYGVLPEGWAIVPEDMELPTTFPFVNIEVEEKVKEVEEIEFDENGEIVPVIRQYPYMEVVSMTEGVVPEPEPIPEPMPEPDEGDEAVTWNELAQAYKEGVNSIDE